MKPRLELLDDLLIDEVTEGLAEEQRDLLRRTAEAEIMARRDSWGLAAAAVHLALASPPAHVELPESLEEALKRRSQEFLDSAAPSPTATPKVRPMLQPPASSRARTHRGWLAAAAATLLAVAGWTIALRDTFVDTGDPVRPSGTLLATAPDLMELGFTATEDPTAARARGKVRWSTTRQLGEMTFVGLEANDPQRFQYQLWIFDGDRDDRYPIDGGVFDVPPGVDEVTVPIDAKLQVGKPVLFAVTVEPPGGVVVSSRERIALLAEL